MYAMSGTPLADRYPLALRVTHSIDRRPGLIIGRAEPNGLKSALYPVAIEGTTRIELWPEHLVAPRPEPEQFPHHGGIFIAPQGYPLNIHDQDPSRSAPAR